MTDIHKQIIIDYQNGIGTTKLSNTYNLHRSTIQSILKRNKIALRKTSPHNTYNVKFFSTYTKESCYWAGFILADGYVRHNRDLISIKLAICDDNHLIKFKTSIKYEGSIHYNKEHTYCYIDICGKWFKDNLYTNFDITPRKSKTTILSDKIPLKYYPDFIRGIIDGDGSITYYRTKNKCNMTLKLYGTYELLNSISSYFYNECNIKMRTKSGMPKIITKKGVHMISYGMKNSNKILNLLYKDTNYFLYLDRKRNRWLELREE